MNPNTELPAWVTLLLVPAAAVLWGWWTDKAFPWLQKFWDAEAHAKREAAKAASDDREARYLVAYEQSTKALNDISQALRLFAEVKVSDNLTLQRIERRMDSMEDRVGRPEPVARRARPPKAPRARERGAGDPADAG